MTGARIFDSGNNEVGYITAEISRVLKGGSARLLLLKSMY